MDVKGFLQSKWEPRQEFIPAPALSDFFTEEIEKAKKENPEKSEDDIILEVVGFTVRGLTGVELRNVADKVEGRKTITSLFNTILSEELKKAGEFIQDKLDPKIDTASATAIYYFVKSLVYPKIEIADRLEVARKLLDKFPVILFKIYRRVEVLTGLGATKKK